MTFGEPARSADSELRGSTLRQDAHDRLARIIPELPDYAQRFAHDGINSRGILSVQERELVILGVLMALGDTDRQLRAHAATALEAGLPLSKLREVILQGIPYLGFPRCINAAFALEQLLTPANDND